MSDSQLLRHARMYFDVHGFIAADIASKLIARGYDVAGLERKWAASVR